nr:unnamed protein product [Callosobruchus chinensis]
MAVVNANYKFMKVHAETNGRVSDGGVLHETTFYKKLVNSNSHLPNPTVSSEAHHVLPYN